MHIVFNPAFRPPGPQLTEDGGNPRPGRRIHANHLPPEVKGQRLLRFSPAAGRTLNRVIIEAVLETIAASSSNYTVTCALF